MKYDVIRESIFERKISKEDALTIISKRNYEEVEKAKDGNYPLYTAWVIKEEKDGHRRSIKKSSKRVKQSE